MIKFKKDINAKIIVWALALVFFMQIAGYGENLPDRCQLRKPLMFRYDSARLQEVANTATGNDTASLASSPMRNDSHLQRIRNALHSGTPVIDESGQYAVRLYFLTSGIHIYISRAISAINIYVSGIKGDLLAYYDGNEAAIQPAGEIQITQGQKEILISEVMHMLGALKEHNQGVNAFLRETERKRKNDEVLNEKMTALKSEYTRQPVVGESERNKILVELNQLLDIKFEELTVAQLDRIQVLLASLGYEPLYPGDKMAVDEVPNVPMDPNTDKIWQGDIVYIQYLAGLRDSEEDVEAEHSGYIRKKPRLTNPMLKMTSGEEINLNDVTEIIVDEGRGGHYKGEKGRGDIYVFLMGGILERDLIQGYVSDNDVVKEGILEGCVNWRGVNFSLPVKIITKTTRTKETVRVWMTGEKVVVLEPPNLQNNHILMYKRSNGQYGDINRVDINRVYRLGVDKDVAQFKSRLFTKGDRVVVFMGDRFFDGAVEDFYEQPFVGRRMVVKINNPPDPSRPYIHVKFVSQLEAIRDTAKHKAAKYIIKFALQRVYGIIEKIVAEDYTEDPVMERAYGTIEQKTTIEDHLEDTTMKFWAGFKTAYNALFGPNGSFQHDDFDPRMIDEAFKIATGMTTSEILNGIPGKAGQMEVIGNLLDESERDRLRELSLHFQLGVNLFSRKVAEGASPWVIKKDDFEQNTSDIAVSFDYSLIGLMRYFITEHYTFNHRIRLAFDLASARDDIYLQGALRKLYDVRDEVSGLSNGALELAAEEFSRGLSSDDQKGVIRLVLGLDRPQFDDRAAEGNVTREDVEAIAGLADSSGAGAISPAQKSLDIRDTIRNVIETSRNL